MLTDAVEGGGELKTGRCWCGSPIHSCVDKERDEYYHECRYGHDPDEFKQEYKELIDMFDETQKEILIALTR